MNTINDAIVSSLSSGAMMLHRFVDDLTSSEYLHRPVPKANCVAWLIGHLTLTDQYAIGILGGKPPQLPEGFDKTFSRDAGCPEAAEFGDVSTLMAAFDQTHNALIEAVKAAPPEKFAEKRESKMPMFATVGSSLMFLALHGAMHAGQISIIRRSLGKPPTI